MKSFTVKYNISGWYCLEAESEEEAQQIVDEMDDDELILNGEYDFEHFSIDED